MDPKFQVIYFALKQKGIFHKPRGRFFRTKRFGAAVLFFLEVGLFGRRGCPEQQNLYIYIGGRGWGKFQAQLVQLAQLAQCAQLVQLVEVVGHFLRPSREFRHFYDSAQSLAGLMQGMRCCFGERSICLWMRISP